MPDPILVGQHRIVKASPAHVHLRHHELSRLLLRNVLSLLPPGELQLNLAVETRYSRRNSPTSRYGAVDSSIWPFLGRDTLALLNFAFIGTVVEKYLDMLRCLWELIGLLVIDPTGSGWHR